MLMLHREQKGETKMTREERDLIRQLKEEGFTKEEIEEIIARVTCGQTLDSAMQTILER